MDFARRFVIVSIKHVLAGLDIRIFLDLFLLLHTPDRHPCLGLDLLYVVR